MLNIQHFYTDGDLKWRLAIFGVGYSFMARKKVGSTRRSRSRTRKNAKGVLMTEVDQIDDFDFLFRACIITTSSLKLRRQWNIFERRTRKTWERISLITDYCAKGRVCYEEADSDLNDALTYVHQNRCCWRR